VAEFKKAMSEEGVQVVSGTPGRILDLIYRKILDVSNLRVVVLDDIDEVPLIFFCSFFFSE
jgi:superfamily II DNA/RNA helicase